jgi:uncharacterized protein (DUF433 family)
MRVEYDFSQARKNPYATKNEWHLCTSVESRTDILGGAWVFLGTRVPVSALFENLRDGLTVNEFVNLYPGVDLIDVTKVLQHAAKSAS